MLRRVVHDLGGVQAQVQTSAELQLAMRVDGITQADVRHALWEARSLAKAWTLRGTLHLHCADELPLWFAARRAVHEMTSDGSEALPAWRDPAGVLHPPLGHEEARTIRQAVWAVLDGRCLSRQALADDVAGRVGPEPRERLRSGFAFFLGDLCQGRPEGSKVTFVRPDQWLEGWHEVEPETALREVCRRFVRTYGPARPGDFAEWFGSRALKGAQGRAIFDLLGPALEEVDVEGHRAYVLAGDASFPDARPGLRLLPEYDAYVMGFRERDRLVPGEVKEQVAAHSRGRYEGPAGVRFLVIDGLAAGLWERKKRGKKLEITVAPTRRLPRAMRAQLDAEIERIGAFTGADAALTID